MVALSTTRLSSKGQVVIPEAIRRRLGLKPGCRFVVMADSGVVIFKSLVPPPRTEFRALATKARRAARAAGLKKADVRAAVRKSRGRG